MRFLMTTNGWKLSFTFLPTTVLLLSVCRSKALKDLNQNQVCIVLGAVQIRRKAWFLPQAPYIYVYQVLVQFLVQSGQFNFIPQSLILWVLCLIASSSCAARLSREIFN